MKPRTLWKCSIATSSEAEDAVAELVGSVFNLPTAISQNTQTGRTLVSVFCPRATYINAERRRDLAAGLKRIRHSGLQLGSGRVSVRQVKSEDWANSWKRHFKPWSAGRALLVKPSWSKLRPRQGQAVLVLDPGLSFGTGQHPTTRFCLKQLVRKRRSDQEQSLLDIGTGSGILAIGAALLGYQPVIGFDFDPDAVRIAKANARVNHMEGRVALSQADLTQQPVRPDRRFDVVCANLMHDLLIAERRRILNRVKTGATLILAGILREQFPAVEKAFAAEGWVLSRGRSEGEWRSGMFLESVSTR